MKLEAGYGVGKNRERAESMCFTVFVFGFEFTFIMNTRLILPSWSVKVFNFGTLGWISTGGGGV